MLNREELKEIILLASSTLGFDIDLNGTELSREEKYALKRELIEGFKMDPVVATFLTNTLKDGIDFDWLEMYEDKRALYQINLGMIQGIDMSFSKHGYFEAIQLEAIRSYIKKGVDMNDLMFPEIDHRNIRILAELKKSGFDYIRFVRKQNNPGYLRAYKYLNEKIKDFKHKEVFLLLPNIFDIIRLINENIDIEKLFEIGFNDLDMEAQSFVLYKLGLCCYRGASDEVRWVFDNINLFEIQEIKMLDRLLDMRNLKELKRLKKSPSEILLSSFGVTNVQGDIETYDAFFRKRTEFYCNNKIIECLKFGLDMSFICNEKITESTLSAIVDILYSMILRNTEKELIKKAKSIFEKSLLILPNKCNVFEKLSDLITSNTKDFSNIDFSALLDQTIPPEFKRQAIIGAKCGIDYKEIVALNFTRYQLTYMLNNTIHRNLLDVFPLGIVRIENLKKLNAVAPFLDLFEFKGIQCASDNIEILSYFSDLKSKKGFYLLGSSHFCCDTVFIAIDALRLDLDIYPYIKDFNDFYANRNILKMIEKELNMNKFTSKSKAEFNGEDNPILNIFDI